MKLISSIILVFVGIIPMIGFADNCRKMSYDEISNNLMAKTSQHLEKKYRMKQIGFGKAGRKTLSLSFQIRRPLEKKEARTILVDSVQEFFKDVNHDEKIRQYLDVYPFSAKNIEVLIFIHKPDGSNFYHPNLSVVSASEGEIVYSTDDPENENRYKSEETESFEDAVKILKSETPTNP